ncbi:MAG: hypothetical protein AB7H77_12575 [Bdellovibrionales bacterium]
MQFELTGLPDQPIFRDAFKAGWTKYLQLFSGQENNAAKQFAKGPVSMARLIADHGGETRYAAAAACLAGPALFCDKPSGVDARLCAFSAEIKKLNDMSPVQQREEVAKQNGDVRLFFQASAILLMEHLADAVLSKRFPDADRKRSYTDALQLYTAARGGQDVYKLDTRFEIAAMKVDIQMNDHLHLWDVQMRRAANAGL